MGDDVSTDVLPASRMGNCNFLQLLAGAEGGKQGSRMTNWSEELPCVAIDGRAALVRLALELAGYDREDTVEIASAPPPASDTGDDHFMKLR